MKSSLCVVFIHLLRASLIKCLDNGLALKPPMGWMSGERYSCQTDCVHYPNDCISERLIKSTVDAMVAKGFRAKGYQFVVLDDCWMDHSRDSSGRLQADLRRFPRGIAHIVDYIHSKNLKIGLYLDIGEKTCGGFPGSRNSLALDAQTMAAWSIDMVKLGACGPQDSHSLNYAYPAFGQYLNQTGRPILYLCEWPVALSSRGSQPNYSEVKRICNQFRTFGDIRDDWQSLLDEIKYYSGYSYLFYNYSGPGSFNDPDQLMLGNFGLSLDQQKFQLALWSILSAPLFISSDLRFMKKDSQRLLLNSMMIAIDQDPLGEMGKEITVTGQVRIWKKNIEPKGSAAIAIFYTNISGIPSKVSISLIDLGLKNAAMFNLTEVLSGKYLGAYKPWYTLNVEVNPTSAILIEAKAVNSF